MWNSPFFALRGLRWGEKGVGITAKRCSTSHSQSGCGSCRDASVGIAALNRVERYVVHSRCDLRDRNAAVVIALPLTSARTL
eukprot:1195916-Prorocentrum_minimum.AAC.1